MIITSFISPSGYGGVGGLGPGGVGGQGKRPLTVSS